MKRREFITLLSSAAACPLVAWAQQLSQSHHIAFMHPTASVGEMSEAGGNPGFRALFQELRRLGHVEGRNLMVERYSAEGGGQKRYTELVPKLVATNPELILAVSN